MKKFFKMNSQTNFLLVIFSIIIWNAIAKYIKFIIIIFLCVKWFYFISPSFIVNPEYRVISLRLTLRGGRTIWLNYDLEYKFNHKLSPLGSTRNLFYLYVRLVRGLWLVSNFFWNAFLLNPNFSSRPNIGTESKNAHVRLTLSLKRKPYNNRCRFFFLLKKLMCCFSILY